MTKFDFFSPKNGGNTMKKILSLLAISFSLAFAYTAADVYGLWEATGGFNFEEIAFGLDKLVFEKSGFDNGKWRFNNGRITFSNSNNYCVLVSAKMMDCHQNYKKITYKKIATGTQLEQKMKQLEKERAKQDSIKKLEELPFYSSMEREKLDLRYRYSFVNITKGEFESTADFNKRKGELDKNIKDSTEFYFNSALCSIIDVIESHNRFNFERTKYDADKQILDVVFSRNGLNIGGKVKMPPEIAKNLKEDMSQFSFKYETTDLRNINYVLIPIKLSIYSANGDEYKVNFDIPKTAKEIVFKGTELWKDNPYAKNLNVSLAEAIKRYPLVKEAEKKAAEERATKKIADYEELIKNGFLIDTRDGKKYKVVKIGNQVWMAENLNYNTSDSML